MKLKVHYHSDCDSFAGCENMLVNFWASPVLRAACDVSFSYRHSRLYAEGLARRARLDFPVFPLRFLAPADLSMLPARWSMPMKRLVSLLLRFTLTVPLLLHEILAMRRLFRTNLPDIVHINNGNYPGALSARAAAVAARMAGVPVVVMVVNNIATGYRDSLRRWLDFPLDRLVAGSVSAFITGSIAAGRRLSEVLRLEEGKCLSLHNGIAPRAITETPGETRCRLGLDGRSGVIFAVVAVLRPNKGHRVLLDALHRLASSPGGAAEVVVVIEGDGPLAEELRQLVADRGLSENCLFAGNEDNVMNLMALMDVLVLPSISHEDFPNVVLEAMRLGKPVIASRIAGTPEQVIEGETGMLVEPGDADSLAAAIAKLASDGELRSRMGRAAARHFQVAFTAETSVRRYVELYRRLLEGMHRNRNTEKPENETPV